jgi:hypothetical protein
MHSATETVGAMQLEHPLGEVDPEDVDFHDEPANNSGC